MAATAANLNTYAAELGAIGATVTPVGCRHDVCRRGLIGSQIDRSIRCSAI